MDSPCTRLSVRRLVEFSLRAGDLTPANAAAMYAGMLGHKARQQQSGAENERAVRWTGTRAGIALELYGRIRQQNYLPKCIVEYDRRAFVVAENDIRITLDSGLRANEANLDLFDPNLNCYPVGELGLVTMEAKFNRFLLSYVKDLVSLSNRTQASVSKYCAARVASLGGL